MAHRLECIMDFLSLLDDINKLDTTEPYGCTVNCSLASDKDGASLGMHITTTDGLDINVKHEDDNLSDAFSNFYGKASAALDKALKDLDAKAAQEKQKEQKRAELEEKMAALQAELDALDGDDKKKPNTNLHVKNFLDDDYIKILRKYYL